MSNTVTRGVRIEVQPGYVPEQSEPAASRWLFAYRVSIRNEGSVPVKLVSRHWIITSGDGQVEEVRGPGVVGQQPHLRPGEAFEYTSYCPLQTPVGTMHGSFHMVGDDGASFDADIRPFRLAVPQLLN